jgi:Na+-driven multidrug efflux pump
VASPAQKRLGAARDARNLQDICAYGNSSGRSLELDAAALALSFMNVTGVSVGIGLSTAAETLCAQMFGFKNYKGLGVVTQRGIWILGLTLFPVFIIWFNTESLLLLIQQDPCVARLSAVYVKIFATALPALFLFFMLQRYLVAQVRGQKYRCSATGRVFSPPLPFPSSLLPPSSLSLSFLLM